MHHLKPQSTRAHLKEYHTNRIPTFFNPFGTRSVFLHTNFNIKLRFSFKKVKSVVCIINCINKVYRGFPSMNYKAFFHRSKKKNSRIQQNYKTCIDLERILLLQTTSSSCIQVRVSRDSIQFDAHLQSRGSSHGKHFPRPLDEAEPPQQGLMFRLRLIPQLGPQGSAHQVHHEVRERDHHQRGVERQPCTTRGGLVRTIPHTHNT